MSWLDPFPQVHKAGGLEWLTPEVPCEGSGSGPLAPDWLFSFSDRLNPSLSFPTCETEMTALPSGKHWAGCGREGVLQPVHQARG